MKPSIQKLHKFLKLEVERGYDNRAVVGGLERIVDHWLDEARADGIPEDLIQVVNLRLRDYANLSPNSRAEALEGLWRRIQRELGITEALQIQSPSPAARVTPPTSVKPSELSSSSAQDPLKPEFETIGEPDRKSAGLRDEDQQSEPTNDSTPLQPLIQNQAAEVKKDPAALDAPVTVIHGVGPRHGSTLAHLGIQTLGDLLFYLPRRYDDYSQLLPINRLRYGQDATVIATVQSVTVRNVQTGRMQVVEAIVNDGTAGMRINWFNQVWIAKRLRSGTPIVLSGKIDLYLGRLVMNNPELELLEQQQLNTNRIVPVYPLTANITQRWLRKILYEVLGYWAPRVVDPVPDAIRQEEQLVNLTTALHQVHFPDSQAQLDAARHRLAFDEIFFLQLGVLRQKYTWQSRAVRKIDIPDSWIKAELASLPYQLTSAQLRTLQDIRQDFASGTPMNRLLQGDVGSGKTVVAALAIAMIAQVGGQSAIMAPTSILAEQHYRTLLNLLTSLPADTALEDVSKDVGSVPISQPPLLPSEVRLLIGSTPEAEKGEIRTGLDSGEIKLIIGTHALLEEPVVFHDLELAIIDEQHRFGVQQRAILRSKGENLHLLVMTATPIPRSLALTVYGDLDLSVIDEMPPGREEVATYLLEPRERERAYQLIRNQVKEGRQAFIIYPLIEENEESQARAAVAEQARLQAEIFPDLKLGLLHGRLRPDEKDAVMGRFRNGEDHILVSTSVVEVGVDVPNATLMLIEGANRFGLAQLHQFRGRVGRGSEKSYCLLIPDSIEAVENERLKVMVETTDGFILAEKDLEQRGPGDFLGTRQSGFNELRMARLTDLKLIEKARRSAQKVFAQDPEMTLPQHQNLLQALQRFWTEKHLVSEGSSQIHATTDVS